MFVFPPPLYSPALISLRFLRRFHHFSIRLLQCCPLSSPACRLVGQLTRDQLTVLLPAGPGGEAASLSQVNASWIIGMGQSSHLKSYNLANTKGFNTFF